MTLLAIHGAEKGVMVGGDDMTGIEKDGMSFTGYGGESRNMSEERRGSVSIGSREPAVMNVCG